MDAEAHPQPAKPLSFAEFRDGFPALREVVYLSVCDKMILHDAVRASVNVFLDRLAMASTTRYGHEEYVLSAKTKYARLMNAAPATIGAIRNVSDGVNSIAWALPWQDGDNVVITAESEHPNNIYPWLRLRKRGVELRAVPAKPDGQLDIEAMIEAMDSRTRLAAAASVTFAPGHRTDLARLSEACRKRDVFLLVDGVQSAGVLQHDLTAEPVDGFIASTSKGLLGLYGFGFLYAAPHWIERLEPAYLSRPAVVQKTDDHSAMGAFDYDYQPDSRRFEVGSFNLAGAYAVDRSLDLLLALTPAEIETRVLGLSALLHEKLKSAGIEPAVPSAGPAHSHILTLGKLDAGGHGFSTDPLIGPASEYLTAQRIVHTIRRGQLRFAFHAYNNESDVERTAAALQDAFAQARHALERK